ncbi:MAG: S9 family peptidase [Alphaproteobacteria bacterium]|nr:S9 family peptidase [Alphaproteobacteria bacterium]
MLKCLLSCSLVLSSMCGDVDCSDLSKLREDTLIPREVLFAKPDKFCVKLSPSGKYISYFARSGNDVVLCVETIEGKLIRRFSVTSARNMYAYCWAYTDNHILIPEDNQGDENDHILCLNIKTGKKKNLTPFDKSKSFVSEMSLKFPNEVLVYNNKRNNQWFDVYKINIETGKSEKVFENNAYTRMIFNENFEPKVLMKVLSNGDEELLTIDGELILRVPFEDAGVFGAYHLKKGENILYASLPLGKDKASLVSINIDTKEIKTLCDSEEADVSLSSCNPKNFEPQLAEVNYLRKKDIPLSGELSDNLNILRKEFGEKEFYIQGRSQDDSSWLIVTQESNESVKYFFFNNETKGLKFLFSNQPALDKYPLQKMEPLVIKSRDGLNLVCYLTKANKFKKGVPAPLVAYIHGGPMARDEYGFNKMAQLLSNRGYSVLQINYRGSTGFGKKFFNAISRNLESVRNDIIDAVQWTIDQKIADKNKVAIMGGSFGGYSALAGIAFTPDFFCCGVDVVGPSNFITLLSSVPEYWKPSMVTWYKIAGNPDVKEDIPYLKSISPLFKKDEIKKPLLVFQGANDPRVAKAESDQIVQALKEKKHPVAYVLYPDEGHGFHREPNIKSYIAFTEKFLSKFLGGWYEPLNPQEFSGSSHKILEGKKILED